MHQRVENEIVLSQNQKYAVSEPLEASARKRDSKHSSVVEVIAKIHFVDESYRDWVVNITVYHDHNINELIDLVCGIARQSVQNAITALPSHVLTKIQGYDGTLNLLPLPGATGKEKIELASWKDSLMN